MARNISAVAIASLLVAAFAGTSRAAPIAPLPSSVAQDGSLTPVWYHHHYWRHRHCWRGYYGRLHCRW
jgi:hypothetical protein